MSEDYFGLEGGTGLKLGKEVAGATNVFKGMSIPLSGCLNTRFEQGYKCLGTFILAVPWFY